MGNQLTSCCSCIPGLGSNRHGNQSGYAFESFNKIPFFGPISNFLNMKKTGGQGGGMLNNMSSLIGMFGKGGQGGGMGGLLDFSKFLNFLPSSSGDSQNSSPFDFADGQHYVKKIKKSNYKEIMDQVGGSDQKYTDQQFPPNAQSLGDLESKDPRSVKWKRIHEIMPNPVLIRDNVDPGDILQGSLGNCYFLSALSSLAEAQHRIKNLFPSVDISPNGVYMARVLHGGVYQEVVVDDYFPVNSCGQPLFAKPSGGNQIWVMVLEKCWAKLHGSYAATVGGLPDQVLRAFSGAPSFYNRIPGQRDKQEQLWNMMLKDFQNGALLCCGTKSDSSIEQHGFVLGHAYTILGVYERPCRLLKLRNPWGQKEWKGRASDYDTDFWAQVSPQDKQLLQYEDMQRKKDTDGIFFLTWEDFVTYYQLVDICKINDNASYNFLPANYQSKIPQMHQIEVKSPGQGGLKTLTIALTQQTTRGKGDEIDRRGYSRSFMALGKLNEGSGKYEYVNSNSARLFADNYLQIEEPQLGTYILYSSYLWNNGRSNNGATVSAYSQSPTAIMPSQMKPEEFLGQIFYDHAEKSPKKKSLNGPDDWMCSDFLLSQGAFGYAVINLAEGSPSRLAIQADEQQYQSRWISLMPPYKGQGRVAEKVEPGKPFVMVMHMPIQNFPQSLSLPQPRISQIPS